MVAVDPQSDTERDGSSQREPTTPARSATPASAMKLQVLIIEDPPVNMALTVAILELAGHVPTQAETAAQGIAMARIQRPDLILMDIQLPDMDGRAATRLLKADAALHEIPVIALTALVMQGDHESMLAAGCDGYVTKPIRYKEFVAELEAVARRAGLPRAR